MDSVADQQTPQANNDGVAFTSSSPFTGYHYSTQPVQQPSSPYWNSPSSILARPMSREASSPMSRTTSTESTIVSSGSDSDSDVEVSSMASHTHRYTQQPHARNNHTPPISPSPFTAPPIALLVGGPRSPSKETTPVPFYVHETLLTSISPFFRAAFEVCGSVGFGESVSREMRLPEERPEDFAFLLQWMYWTLSHQRDHDSGGTSGGLWHADIDGPLEAYRLYGEKRKAERQVERVAKEKEEWERYTAATSTIGAIVSGMPVPQLPVPTQPQPPQPQTTQTLTSVNVVKPTDAVPSNPKQESTQTQPSKFTRPAPPAFGPLIRLYILADKYSLPTQLKHDVCMRVREVGREGRCLPDADDVALLWDSVLETPLMEPVNVEARNLKETVLDLYEGLGWRSARLLFYGSLPEPETSMTTEAGAATATMTPETVHKMLDGDEDGYKWHPTFMRDLMYRMFAKANGQPLAVRCRENEGEGVSGGGGDGLRRVRRGERFPSLYGGVTRSTVERG